MASVIVHRPIALSLPEHSRRTRRFLDKRSQLPGHAPLGPSDYAEYDTRSIFHDVFLDGEDICAVGPPLLNLAREVLPARLRVRMANGSLSDVLRHRLRKGDRVLTHRFRLPVGLRDADEARVSINLATGQQAELCVHRPALAPVFLQFATLQKNSPFRWIADWLGHASRLGVDRVILYDNGSDDSAALPDRLRALTLAPEVVLVHWPYVYGPLRNYRNRFSQPSQIAHVHACFGASVWSGNFDIDEYPLVGPGTESVVGASASPDAGASYLLSERLSRCSPRTGLLRLDSYWVPRLEPARPNAGSTNANHAALPTARDFALRERQLRGKSYKYLLRRKALREPRIHNARLRFGWWRALARPDDLVFLHYKALTTGWKQYHDRQSLEAVDPSRHVEERRVQASLAALDAVVATREQSSIDGESRSSADPHPQQVNS